jgi:hypothetical protein
MKTAPLTPPLTVASEGWLGDRLRQFDEMVRGEAVAAKVLAARELAEATSTQQGVLDLIGYLRDANPDGDWSTYQRLVQRVGDAPDEVVAMFGLGGEWAASGAAERGAGIACNSPALKSSTAPMQSSRLGQIPRHLSPPPASLTRWATEYE